MRLFGTGYKMLQGIWSQFLHANLFLPTTHLEKPNPSAEPLITGHHSGCFVGCCKVLFFKAHHRARPSGTRDEFL